MRKLIQFPLYETPGGISGGGSGGGPVGGGASVGSGGDSGGGAAPQHVEISNDSYIKVPGSDKPVKYSDYIGGYVSKADFTRAQQQAAAERQRLERASQEQEARFRAAASRIMQRIGGNQGPDPNSLESTLSQLESREYVDGKTAAGIVRNLVQTSVLPLAQAIRQRDQALGLMFKRLQALDGTVGTIRNRTVEGDFKTRVANAKQSLTSAGFADDPVLDEMVQDFYAAYEGPDLDQELPGVIRNRLSALRNYFRALDKKEAETARHQRLGLPGKGGAAAPGRPLRKGFQSPQQIADELWPGISGSET